jgi:hypothetical protein
MAIRTITAPRIRSTDVIRDVPVPLGAVAVEWGPAPMERNVGRDVAAVKRRAVSGV